jgi:hypothetical protein
MKKIISLLSIMLVLAVSTHSFAQLGFGVRTGLNISNMRVSGFTGVTESSRISYHVGAILAYNFSDNFALESGLFINSKGANFELSQALTNTLTLTLNQTLSPLFLEVPINAVYKVDIKPVKVIIYGGPYFAFGISGNRTNEYSASGLPAGTSLSALLAQLGIQNETIGLKYGTGNTDDLRGFDFGLNFGAGVEYNNFLFRVQYGLGLNNLNPVSANNEVLKINVLSFSVGYMFGN